MECHLCQCSKTTLKASIAAKMFDDVAKNIYFKYRMPLYTKAPRSLKKEHQLTNFCIPPFIPPQFRDTSVEAMGQRYES